MKNLKTYTTIFLLLILTFSSVGVAISKHVCHSEGVTEISLTGVSGCGEHENETAAKNCCKKPINQSEKKPGCCDEDFVYAVLDIAKKQEDKQQEKIFLKPLVSVVLPYLPNNVSASFITVNVIDTAPPLTYSSVNNFLADISIFRL